MVAASLHRAAFVPPCDLATLKLVDTKITPYIPAKIDSGKNGGSLSRRPNMGQNAMCNFHADEKEISKAASTTAQKIRIALAAVSSNAFHNIVNYSYDTKKTSSLNLK